MAKQKKDKSVPGFCVRALPIVPSTININERSVEIVLTTDDPVMVMDWNRWEPMREVLLTEGAELPASVPLLNAHQREEIENILGTCKDFRAEGNKIYARNYFATTDDAETAFTLVREGHATDNSIGYTTYEAETIYLEKDQSIEINGRTFINNFADGLRYAIRKRWGLKENSVVPIGANLATKNRAEIGPDDLEKRIEEIENKTKELNNTIISITKSEVRQMSEIVLTPEQIAQNERARIAEIEAIATKFEKNVSNIRDLKINAINTNVSADQFRANVFDKVDFSKPIDTGVGDVDLSNKDLQEYSLTRAINAKIDGNWDKAKHEKLISDEIASRSGQAPKGFFVPQQYLNKGVREWLNMNQRTAITTTNAASLIQATVAGNMWIDLLRNKMVTMQAGAKMLTGLVGNLDMPKQLTAGTFHWVAEQGTGTATNLTVSKLSLTPKDGWAQQSYGRRTFLQTNPSIEGLIINDLNNLAALGLDYAGLMGPGTNSPTGVAHTNSVGSVAFASAGTLTWDKIVEFETDVEVGNADVAGMKFITNPRVKGKGKTTLKTSGIAGYICEGNQMNGYDVLSTNQVDAGYLLFGDFSQLIYGEWGLTDLQVNPYNDNGDVKLTLFVTADVGVRQPGAFSVSTNAEA
jgi:HK97 family phage major capsid protein